MKKRKPKTLVEVFAAELPGTYPSKFRNGTLGFVLDQEKGVEKVTAARKAQIFIESIRGAVDELSQRTIDSPDHLSELDDIGRRLEIIIQEIDEA